MIRYKCAHFIIEDDIPGKPLIIRDVGPWETYLSVTNDAESVTLSLFVDGRLSNGRRLFYYDTEGQLDELVHNEGRFIRFAPIS